MHAHTINSIFEKEEEIRNTTFSQYVIVGNTVISLGKSKTERT